jgi:PilZ domain
MQIPFFSDLGFPSWQVFMVSAVGVVTAWLTLFGFFMLVRHQRRKPEEKPAENHDPFEQGSVGESRRAVRRKGNHVEILVTDAEVRGEPVLGWVVDRSQTGLCLILSEELTEGTILSIKPRQHPPATPWVKVRVRNCKRDAAGFFIGCEFERIPPWGVMLLFG